MNSGQVKVELVTPNGQAAVRDRHLAAKAQRHVSSRLLGRSDSLVRVRRYHRDGSRAGLAELDTHVQRDAYRRTDRPLFLAFTLPIRRYRSYIAPSGAGDEVVEDVANDFNSPIKDKIRSRSPDAGIASVTTATCSTHC